MLIFCDEGIQQAASAVNKLELHELDNFYENSSKNRCGEVEWLNFKEPSVPNPYPQFSRAHEQRVLSAYPGY